LMVFVSVSSMYYLYLASSMVKSCAGIIGEVAVRINHGLCVFNTC
jgi:hypothetical protein